MAQVYKNYINGQWQDAHSGQTKPSVNPANIEEEVGHYQMSSVEDVQNAIDGAQQAFAAWSELPGAVRGNYLCKAADILERRLDEIATTMTKEMGKTLPEAKGETMRGVVLLRYYAGEGMRQEGTVIPSIDGKTHMYSKRVPLGVVGLITPWNFPVAIPIWKAAPALVYGNTVVFKPASEASVTAAKIVEVFQEAEFPPGVVQLITGSGRIAGSAMLNHPQLKAVSFTGSNTIGREIGSEAAKQGKKYQLEMGGHNPAIIDQNCDLELAVEQVVNGAMKSAGQKCTTTSRAIVLRAIYDAFKERLLAKIGEITVGDGMDPGTWMGPVVNQKQLDTIVNGIEEGKRSGATLLAGGNRLTEGVYAKGYYVEPTVFENVTQDSILAQEEIFGPVLALIPADDLNQAFALANNVRYGLSASLFTRDVNNAFDFVDSIEAGMVRINGETAGVEPQAPFGGMKESSSYSREQGQAAKEFYTTTKTVAFVRY